MLKPSDNFDNAKLYNSEKVKTLKTCSSFSGEMESSLIFQNYFPLTKNMQNQSTAYIFLTNELRTLENGNMDYSVIVQWAQQMSGVSFFTMTQN